MSQPNSRSPRGLPAATAPRPRRFGFALWVGVAGASLVAAMAVFQVYDIARRHALVIENNEHLFASLVHAMGEQTARSLQTVDVVVRDTAASGDSRQDLPAAQRRLRDRVLAVPQIRQLLVFDTDGHVLASSANVDPLARSIAEQAYFQTHRDTPGALPQISTAAPPSGKGPGTIVLSRRIDDRDGRFAGVAAAYIDLDYFNRFYASFNLGQGTTLTLLGSDGVVLASYPNTVAEIGRPYPDAATVAALFAASTPPATVLQRAANARGMIYAAEQVPDFPLAVVASVDEDVVLRAWHVQALHSTARTTLLCVSVVLLIWLMLRQLRRRERAEERLRVQTAQLDELFESAPEAIVMLDLGQRVTRVNREFTRMFGYSAHQACSHTLERLIVPADLLDESRWMDEALSRGQRVSRETERAGKDGARVHVTLLGAPIVAATGQIASYAIYRDITERRLAEAEHTKLETRLRQAEKLDAIGTMAGGIAHDFNNILTAILGYGDMALTA
ncbi:MAG: PAS domain S-box protein, partial [Betaproteobacteria bacterium]